MPDPNVDAQLIEQARRQVNRLAEEIAQLSEANLSPPEYYGEFLQRLLAAIAAPAGAVWIRTAQGNLVLQYQIRMREVGLDAVENGRQIHDELLRQSVMKGQPVLMQPHSGLSMPGEGAIAAGNPTNFMTLIAPILVDKQVAGLVEVWQDPARGPDAQRGFLQFMVRMAALAANYTRNHQLRQMSSQQQVWAQLEAFAKQVHNSLNPTEVAYLVANEGRRLIECDRVSVGLREGVRCQVRAISGADVIEKRSNLVKLMRALFDTVLQWGEKLVYSGSKDESLPPRVLRALDDYLAESNSKLLVIMPLRDDREKNPKKPARSILMMECFEPQVAPEQLTARLEVVAKHATSALYNSWEYRKIPFRFVWVPIARVQEGLGGKAKAIVTLITFLFFALVTAMIVIPYPLKIDANGHITPKKWQAVYAQMPGQVMGFKSNLDSFSPVNLDENLVKLHSTDLEREILDITGKRDAAKNESSHYGGLISSNPQALAQIAQWNISKIKADGMVFAMNQQLEKIRQRTNADLGQPGVFWAKAPLSGMVLSHNFKQNLLTRFVQPNEPLLKAGYTGPAGQNHPEDWEIELKIPQKHVGQVMAAFKTNDPEEKLDVDFLVMSRTTEIYKGKLARKKIAPEATPDRTDNNEAENVIIAWVNISDNDIPKASRLPPGLLQTGVEVHSRIRCGNHPMGYSLFYGVWEFIYEKVVFFF